MMIRCETCGTRLKVKDESAVGQIVPCPRCGGLVQIVAAEPSLSPEDQSPIQPAEQPQDEPVTASEAPSELPAAETTDAEELLNEQVAELEGPPPAWWKRPPMVGALAAGVVVLAAIGFAVRGSSQAKNSNAAAEKPSQVDPSEAESESESEAPAEPIVDAQNADSAASPHNESETTKTAEAVKDQQASPAEENAGAELPPDLPDLPPVPPQDRQDDPFDLAADDPFDLLPWDEPINEEWIARTPETEAQPPPPAVEQSVAEPAPVRMWLRVDADVARVPSARGAAHRLSMPIARVELVDTPLHRLLEKLSAAAGVPISFDPQALQVVGNTHDGKITANFAGQTMQEILQQVAGDHGWVCEIGQEQVRLTLPTQDQVREYQVGDFLPGDSADSYLAEFSKQLEGLVLGGIEPIELGQRFQPKSPDEIHVTGDLQIHARTDDLLQRLRTARRSPPRGKAYPTSGITWKQTSPTLQQTFRFESGEAMELAAVFEEWSRLSGVTFLVDWYHLRDQGWFRDSAATTSVRDQPLRDALDGLLPPLGLAWQPVSETAVYITSDAYQSQLLEIGFFPLSQGSELDNATASRRIHSLLNELEQAGVDRESLPLLYDPKSQTLILTATSPQLELAYKHWRNLTAPAAADADP